VHPPERWFALPGETGLFTCTWPKSEYLKEGVRYREEVWTGIEYQVAGHMVWENMVTEALAICRGVEDRYKPAKHNPFNEIECGDHYARAFASWGVYTALSGFEYHGPKGHIGFAPRVTPENFRAAFTTAEGWGSFAQTRQADVQQEQIQLHRGWLKLKTLTFRTPQEWKAVDTTIRIDGSRTLSHESRLNGAQVNIDLAQGLLMPEGHTLQVEIQRRD